MTTITTTRHPLLPDTVIVSTWGYDQTNVDFLTVIERKVRKDGSTWVKVQRLESLRDYDTGLFMQYRAVPGKPMPDRKPIWRKARPSWDGEFECIEPESYSWGRPWSGEPVWGSSYA